MRAAQTSRPTAPPPMKAISDSRMVHCVASSRLRRMSQKVNCAMAQISIPSGPPEHARADQAEDLAEAEAEQQVDRRDDEIDLEAAEIARLDEVAGEGQLLRRDLRHHRGTQHDDDELRGQRGIDLLQSGQQHDMAEDLPASHREAEARLPLAPGDRVDAGA